MRSGWRATTLGDICDASGAVIQTGPFGSQLHSYDYQPTGTPVVPTEAIGQRRINPEGLPRISAEKAESLKRHLLRAGDILFARRGVQATGSSALVRHDQAGWLCGTGAILLRIETPEICPEFLSFALSTPTAMEWLKAHAVGAVMPNLNEGVLRSMPLLLPPLTEQRAIAGILGSLDGKIDLNQQMNKTLEAMARTVFRSWFVDFDPVRAKVAGRQPDGLDAATASLFPDKLEDSPLGPVPQGWRVVALGDHVEVAKGLSYKGEGLAEAGVALHNLNSVYEGGGYKHQGIKHYVGEYRPCHVIRAGDVLVTNTEQGHDHLLIGYSALIPKRYGDLGLFSHHTYRVRPQPESPLTPPFIHHLLLTHRFRSEVIGYTNGTTVNMLPADGLKRPRLVLPPAKLIRRFTDFVVPLIDKAEANEEESRSLALTRDALLPKLLSGEVRPGN